MDGKQHYVSVQYARKTALYLSLGQRINSYTDSLDPTFIDCYKDLLARELPGLDNISDGHAEVFKSLLLKEAQAMYASVFQGERKISQSRADYGEALRKISLIQGVVLGVTMLGGVFGIGVLLYDSCQQFLLPVLDRTCIIEAIEKHINQGMQWDPLHFNEQLFRQQIEALYLDNNTDILKFVGAAVGVLVLAGILGALPLPIKAARDYADAKACQYHANLLATTVLEQAGHQWSSDYTDKPDLMNVDNLSQRDVARVLWACIPQAGTDISRVGA